MPFSIKRLTHLNRSQSLQGRKDNANKPNSQPGSTPEQNAYDQQQAASSKSSKSANAKQSKSKSKHKSGNDVSGQARPDTNSVSTGNALMSSLASLHHHQQQQQQQHQLQQQLQQQHQHQQQRHEAPVIPQHVPPSFVIRNQTNIGSAFQPVSSQGYKFEPIPNSRSFDSNEIRRLTNQSNAHPPPYTASANEPTLSEWNKNNRSIDAEESAGTRASSGTKRVHYAAHTFTRASSLTGHASSGHANNNLLNNVDERSEIVKPNRMILSRQTSTTTPTSSVVTSTMRNGNVQAASNGQANQSSSSCGPVSLPRGGEEVLINGGGHRGRSSSKPTTNSRHYAKQLYTSSSIDVAMTDSLGDGSTSNGSGSKASHARTDESSRNNRTSQKSSSNKADNASNNPELNSNQNRSTSSKGPSSQQPPMANVAPITQRSSSTTPLDRNFYNMQVNQASLFDDDPGIMSEIETSATGFRRGNKIRASLPIVRTPSKSQDRSLGLVFLQFRSETKRALLPNEITSIDTVKALFVRSFPRQLTMEYLDHPSVRIYIHDPSKDMFYELEDLRDVKDRCILRIYEQGVNGPQPGGGGLPASLQAGGPDASENYGYFSEPEFDSEFQSQHVHRKRFPPSLMGQSLIVGPNPMGQSQYYGTIMLPPQYRSATLGLRPGFISNQSLSGQPPQPPTRSKAYPGYSQTLPRGTHLMSPSSITPLNNPFGIPSSQPAPPKPQRSFAASPGPQGGLIVIQGHPRPALPGSMAPTSASVPQHLAYHQSRPLPDRPYSVAGHYPSPDRMGARIPYPQGTNPNNADFSGYLSSPEHRPSAAMLTMHPGQPQARSSFSGYPSASRPFDAEMANVPAGVFPHPGVYPSRNPSGVMDEESRVRMQEMERQIATLTSAVSKALGSNSKAGSKPAPPPKPPSLIGYRSEQSTTTLSSDATTQLKQIRRRARDLRSEVRALKRFALQQTNTTKESLKETCNKIKDTLSFLSATSDIQLRLERLRVSTDRDSYNDQITRLDKDLLVLEAQVEELRSNVINRRCRVNMSHVESMALILSRASKTVADLKARYPSLAQNMKSVMSKELQQIEKEEKFLKEEPERLELSLKRCKKLTGTLVTLKRLASVQEQRSTTNPNTSSPSQLLQSISDKKDNSLDENVPIGFSSSGHDALMTRSYDVDLMEPHTIIQVTPATPSSTDSSKTSGTSNMLENLLDELQTFSKQSSIDSPSSNATQRSAGSLRGLNNKPILINNSDTIARKARSKSYSSLRANSEPPGTRARTSSIPDGTLDLDSIALLATKCGNSAAATAAALMEKRFAQSRQELLEQRHQELLRKQRQLQEQYTRLQQLSRGQIPRGFLNDLKKTGSESNLAARAAVASSVESTKISRVPLSSTVHGSLKNLAHSPGNTLPRMSSGGGQSKSTDTAHQNGSTIGASAPNDAINKKIFETDIL